MAARHLSLLGILQGIHQKVWVVQQGWWMQKNFLQDDLCLIWVGVGPTDYPEADKMRIVSV